MIRFVLVASLLVGCRYSLENNETDDDITGRACTASTTSASCLEAEAGNHADLAWIEANIFRTGCALSEACHKGPSTRAKQLDLRVGFSHAALVNKESKVAPSRTLVVPNDIHASYLMLMLRDFAPADATPPGEAPPSDVRFMPQDTKPLCCQKMDAIERWIMAGAPTN